MLSQAEIAASLLNIDQAIQSGRSEAAEALCRQLLAGVPDCADAWLRLGYLLVQRGDNIAAEDVLERAAQMQSQNPAIWNQRSIAFSRRGCGHEAEQCARRAIAIDSSNGSSWANLGAALMKQWSLSAAAEALRQSLTIQPGQAAVWNNLADAELKSGNLDAARQALERAMALAPSNIEPIANYAFLLCRMGRHQEAEQWLQARLLRQADSAERWMMLGELWQRMAQWALAEAAYRRALEIVPDHTMAKYQLARMLRSQRRIIEAEDVVRSLLACEPDHASGWSLLGEVLTGQGRAAEGAHALRRSVEITPGQSWHGRFLTALQFDEATPESLFVEHQKWDSIHAQPLRPKAPPAAAQRLSKSTRRIGLLSSDFGMHPTGFMVLPAIECLDRAQCSVICYSDRAYEDNYTARFRAASDQWRVVFGLSDESIAEQIRRDQIDILFDLAGHNGERMLVFARKPAPVQITWLGYVGTTGLATMDYLLADRFHVHEVEERWYRESVLRMPNGYACYGAPPDAPSVGPLPAAHSEYFTFGCFNKTDKIPVRLRETWVTILHRAPHARLFLKTGGFDEPAMQSRWRDWFRQQGIPDDRLILEGWSEQAELMNAYNRVDLALDSQPYSGGLTTCEALWMGVPVVTWSGNTFAGRHSTSHLANAGYEQFVSADRPSYIDLAVEWSRRIDELADLCAIMREQVRRSPLCDAPRFANDLLNTLQKAWNQFAKRANG